ncbi:MAG: hypothetical protein ABIP08_13320 [Lautropia sp.]
MTASLFQRLGGDVEIEAIVDDAIDRHAANPLLAARLRGRDLPQLKTISASLLSARAGGPRQVEDSAMSMKATMYAGMSFRADEWAAVMDDIAAAMAEHGVRAVEVREVADLLQAAAGEALRR